MEIYSVKNLEFCYPGDSAPSLKDINFSIDSGSYTIVCGTSGSGKTTLLRHLKTILSPHGKRKGEIKFAGESLDFVPEAEQACRIGFVMQDPDAQIVTDKVWHELAFGLESMGIERQEMRVRVAEMASYFNMQDWFDKDISQLSGGQKQMLNLASVMAMNPDVLILDEPCAQLDPIAASEFLENVRKINLEIGTTIIISEHRLEEIYSEADNIIVMDGGEISCIGSPRDVGVRIYESKHNMMVSLPSPMRIYIGVNVQCELPIFADAAPLSVRDGRIWLSNLLAKYAAGKRLEYRFAKQVYDGEVGLEPGYTKDSGRESVLTFDDVWFRYERNSPDILRGMTFSVPKSSLFAMVGGNGVGKSTALKAAMGICKPYRGKITLGDKGKTSGAIALLPQNPLDVLQKDSVIENLEDMLKAQSIPVEERAKRIEEIAKITEIENLLEVNPYDLSGGERQRAGLAMILMANPSVLLLDEPTKSLDNFYKAKLARLFYKLIDQGKTIIMVSHDLEFCAKYAAHIAMVFDGGIVGENSAREFFSNNNFYTTAASRMSRNIFEDSITTADVISFCTKNISDIPDRGYPDVLDWVSTRIAE